jgi:Bacterial antitoxin of type II TA system, VapB
MRTNIDIDDRLMRQAMRSSRSRTKWAAVEEGLRLLIRTQGQAIIRRLRGKPTDPEPYYWISESRMPETGLSGSMSGV